MSNAETGWGPWHDPDTTQGMQELAVRGLQHDTPERIAALDDAMLQQVAADCGLILEQVYQGTYPLSAGHADDLARSIRAGQTHLSTLRNPGGGMVGMAALVEQTNPTGGPVNFAELGRAAKAPGAAVPVRSLLKGRVPWGLDNLPHVDHLVSSTRSAGAGNTILPSGKGVQSVWVGGRRYGQSSLVVNGGSWRYRLQAGEGPNKIGGIEPFLHFTMPTDPARWAEEVPQQPVYVPTESDAYLIHTMIAEGTGGRVKPSVQVIAGNGHAELPLHQIEGPSRLTTAKFVAGPAVKSTVGVEMDIAAADAALPDTMGQEVTLDTSTPQGATMMAKLRKRGWTLVGWQASPEQVGGVWPLMARVNPRQMADLIMPGHHSGYFDASGLPQTRAILDETYRTMLRQAAVTAAARGMLVFA